MANQHLKVVYIRPSKYDDEGYVWRFWRGVVPSNTLCCLESLTQALADSGELGEDVEVSVETYDDTLERIPIKRIARENRKPGTRVVVGFVGVQTNQFPRAVDLALALRAEGVQTMIGGFHVSGMLAMFDAPSPELQQCIDHGVALVKGEAEAPGALAGILRDALAGEMQPIYDIREFPDLENAPVPTASERFRGRYFRDIATIDTSRGCPFNCSFCTIINVQGRKMRHRSAACVLNAIEENYTRGVSTYFFTDDNFARNPVWEEILDGLIAMRERGMDICFMIQTDTRANQIPGFVEKAARAGCYMVFIGMESVNPKNLEAVGKGHNCVDEYAAMAETWRQHNVTVHAGYIIGLPHDSPQSVQQDIDRLKNEVKVDKASLFMMTPLPGSRDHWQMVQDRVPLDADLNNYDSMHETCRHPNMAAGEWMGAYHDSMESLYDKENIVNTLLRTPRDRYYAMLFIFVWYRYSALERIHPMAVGVYRLKDRKSRRPIFPRENVFQYAWRRVNDAAHGLRRYASLFLEFQEIWLLTRKPEDPRWATLADIRAKWAEVQLRVRECDIRGRCDVAAQELKTMLMTVADRMSSLSKAGGHLSRSTRRRLRDRAKDIENYVRTLDVQLPRWHKIVEAEKFSESILAGYEELAIRYVAKRRKFNAYRKELINHVKSGRILTMNIGRIPTVLLFEILFACRFGTHMFTHVLMHR